VVKKRTVFILALMVGSLWLLTGAKSRVDPASPQSVVASAREIPLAYDVDMVVVGGTSRGVAAAVAAAGQGAKVFLAAPYPYLGEDLCGSGYLWLEEGEEPGDPLSRAIYRQHGATATRVSEELTFSYTASLPSARRHPDTSVPSRLTDGLYGSAVTESVEYNGDVVITADLGKPADISEVCLLAFQREDFELQEVSISVSEDQSRWEKIAMVTNPQPDAVFMNETLAFSAAVNTFGRYVRLETIRKPGVDRVLLGELIIRNKAGAGEETPSEFPANVAVTPMQVKRTLDEALLEAGVDFLYGCSVSELLHDSHGRISGIVMVNRSGRQAVRAKVVVDATDRATAARMTSAFFAPYPAGKHSFKRLVLDGTPANAAVALDVEYRIRTAARERENRPVTVFQYVLDLPMKDGTWHSFARADQAARDQTWQDGQVWASEMLFQVPPDPVKGRQQHAGGWPGAEKLDLNVLRPHGVDGMYVLGGCADVSRKAAARLMRPVNGIPLGTRVGIAAATEAKAASVRPADELTVAGAKASAGSRSYVIGEILNGLRSSASLQKEPFVKNPAMDIPVLGQYDVVVVGGGTGGAPAGIAAARRGAKTLVLESLHGLGGVSTLGRITRYWHGNRVGFTAEIDQAMGATEQRDWDIEKRMEWLRREIVTAGGEVWFHSSGCGAVLEGRRVVGVVVSTPFGRGIILAGSVVDSTGNAVIPSCAGAPFADVDGEHISVQGTGLPPYTPGRKYLNTDWCFSDDNDVVDMWRMFVVAKQNYKEGYDLGQLIDTRVRRRIIGDVIISPMDILNERLYPDVITVAKSNFDNHGFSSHTLFMVTPPDKRRLTGNIPYRALLPKGYDGILVTGLGISAHGDALPVLRMQPDVQNQGYAAGLAAAMAAEKGATVRTINVKELQRYLVEKNIIPESMLTAKDSYPIDSEKMKTAVQRIGEDYRGISLVLADPDRALPLLRDAWRATDNQDKKLRYAHVLGMLYDATGSETLIDAIRDAEWDEGWNFRGMHQFGATTSPMDNLIIALGRTGDLRGVPVVLEKLSRLDASSELSHCRAVSVALESYRDPRAAKPLARLLRQEGIMGHAYTEILDTIARTPSNPIDNSTRQGSLRELILARALYRCGDHEGLGEKILRQYADDYRGVYARHAKAVLEETRRQVRETRGHLFQG